MELGGIPNQGTFLINDIALVQLDIGTELIILALIFLFICIHDKRKMRQLFSRLYDVRAQLGSRATSEILCRGSIPRLTRLALALFFRFFIRMARLLFLVILTFGVVLFGITCSRRFFIILRWR